MNTLVVKNLLLKVQQPYILILIGPPLVGKSSFIKKLLPDLPNHDIVVVSRDEILLDTYGSDDYEEAFKNVNQKEVDRRLISKIKEAAKEHKNVIIDMTHMTRKRRVYNLSFFSKDYYKLGIIFPILDDAEYTRRNTKRKSEEKKDISPQILRNMIKSYQPVDTKSEGFDRIISL